MFLILRRGFATHSSLLCTSEKIVVPPLKMKINKSKVPKIREKDLEEKYITGWGPGGQAVNKTLNAVYLRHVPSGVWIKCHESRSLDRNRKTARKMLIEKLDLKINGEDSVQRQEERLASHKRNLKREKTRLKYEERRKEKENQSETDQENSSNKEDDLENIPEEIDKK
eukprot:TRINITY_DN4068_c0_g1_i5.p1 TRINITY_DN4068_c0_g1~~TRINITY_DN4068_c0_g1_i5.p1  ORF type:complete len:169 (-),score=23.10 TRINITY_DN4068_c0_g1_i5:101-607(-)